MTQRSASLAAIVVAGALSVSGCSKEPDYATIEGTAHVLLEFGGISDQGIQLTIPTQEILIKPVDTVGTEYRGLLMPEVVFMSESGSRRESEPLSLIRSGQRYRFYGFPRTLEEVHTRYREAGGTGVYYPEEYFRNAKFFDVHEMEPLD
jgi:hypothetical protein